MKKLLVLFLLISKISLANDYVSLAQKSLPSVVAITSEFDDKELVGSGFIIDETGLIVTNAHVVKGAKNINVLINNNQTFKATLKGADDILDIALIKVETFELLKYVKLANSDNIKVGQNVMAVGNPMGLGVSVSTGIISAKSRDINSSPYDDFIQTDAAINIGNSGGPLFDTKGNVLGMVTAMYSQNLKNSGIGFALPSNQLNLVIQELKKNGKITRGWIGLSISPGLNNIKISEVVLNSPVHKAGLLVGDEVLSINSKKIKNSREFLKIVANTKIGQNIKIETNRGIFDVDVIKNEEELQSQEQLKTCIALGMELNENTLEVINITNGSDAFIKGLKGGDVIKSLDNNLVLNCQDISSYLLEAKRLRKNNIMAKIITQDGNTHFVELNI